jgi:hypothetical protein
VPIITFVDKLDREARDPFDVLDEIEQSLALGATPTSWPIGMGRDFLGTYDPFADVMLLFERSVYDRMVELVSCNDLDDLSVPVVCRKPRPPNCGMRSRWHVSYPPTVMAPSALKGSGTTFSILYPVSRPVPSITRLVGR